MGRNEADYTLNPPAMGNHQNKKRGFSPSVTETPIKDIILH